MHNKSFSFSSFLYLSIYLSIYLSVYLVYIYIYIHYIYIYICMYEGSTTHRVLKSHRSKMSVIYKYICNHQQNVSSLLLTQWLCGNSCTCMICHKAIVVITRRANCFHVFVFQEGTLFSCAPAYDQIFMVKQRQISVKVKNIS